MLVPSFFDKLKPSSLGMRAFWQETETGRQQLIFCGDWCILLERNVKTACFGAYGWAGPVRRCAVNHVRRGTEQH